MFDLFFWPISLFGLCKPSGDWITKSTVRPNVSGNLFSFHYPLAFANPFFTTTCTIYFWEIWWINLGKTDLLRSKILKIISYFHPQYLEIKSLHKEINVMLSHLINLLRKGQKVWAQDGSSSPSLVKKWNFVNRRKMCGNVPCLVIGPPRQLGSFKISSLDKQVQITQMITN